jgi:hypothetical protein
MPRRVDVQALRNQHAPVSQKAGGALCDECNVWMPCAVTELLDAYEECMEEGRRV